MDRTVATGTGFIGQYRPPVAAMFESLDTCPDELLLFMHHVPYTHSLHSGKTVIQHFYDSHYQGAEDAAGLVDEWRTLKRHIDDQRYREVLDRLRIPGRPRAGVARFDLPLVHETVAHHRTTRAASAIIRTGWKPRTSDWTATNLRN